MFTPVEFSSVGLTETQAKETHQNVLTYHLMEKSLTSKIISEPFKYVPKNYGKLITSNDKIIGIHYFGENAADIMQGFACCLNAGIDKK